MTAKATETLHHPTLNVTREVDAKSVAEWQESGWLKTEPKAVRESKADEG